MEFFLNFDNKYVPIGKYGNKTDAIAELLNPLYENIIRSRMNNGRMFLIKRKKGKIKGDRIRLSSVPLRITEKEGKIFVEMEGKFKTDSAC